MTPEEVLELAKKSSAKIEEPLPGLHWITFCDDELEFFANECQALVLDAWGKQAPVAWFNRNTGEFIKDEGDVGFLNFIPLYAAPKPAGVIVDCSAYGVHRHKVFKNSADHAQALARLTELMALDPKEGSKEDDELEILALVIEDYERNIAPPVAPKPDAKRSSTEQQTRQSAEP